MCMLHRSQPAEIFNAHVSTFHASQSPGGFLRTRMFHIPLCFLPRRSPRARHHGLNEDFACAKQPRRCKLWSVLVLALVPVLVLGLELVLVLALELKLARKLVLELARKLARKLELCLQPHQLPLQPNLPLLQPHLHPNLHAHKK